VVRGGGVVILLVYKRIRHLVVFLATLAVTDWVVTVVLFVSLPPPTVPALVPTTNYLFPSKPVSALAITLFSAVFVLFPPGRPRRWARVGSSAVLVVVILAGLCL